ncbi:hypothetical protein BJX76DRAFT_216629 [Aspergillus varians]
MTFRLVIVVREHITAGVNKCGSPTLGKMIVSFPFFLLLVLICSLLPLFSSILPWRGPCVFDIDLQHIEIVRRRGRLSQSMRGPISLQQGWGKGKVDNWAVSLPFPYLQCSTRPLDVTRKGTSSQTLGQRVGFSRLGQQHMQLYVCPTLQKGRYASGRRRSHDLHTLSPNFRLLFVPGFGTLESRWLSRRFQQSSFPCPTQTFYESSTPVSGGYQVKRRQLDGSWPTSGCLAKAFLCSHAAWTLITAQSTE